MRARWEARYDGGDSFQEVQNGTSTIDVEFVRGSGLGGGIGSILYSDRGATREHFTYNAVGHTVALTRPNGTVAKSDLYEAFGNIVASTGSSPNNRLANTKERSFTLGLDNHGFRYFDPEIGRYITRDPIGYGDGLNVYLYVHNNPINQVDPLGLSKLDRFKRILKAGAKAFARDADGRLLINGRKIHMPEGLQPGQVFRFSSSETPELAKKYSAGVKFDSYGFPDFSPYLAKVEGVKSEVPIKMVGDGRDFAAADKAAGITQAQRDKLGLTWHHHQDGETMQLVPRDLNSNVPHEGGASLARLGQREGFWAGLWGVTTGVVAPNLVEANEAMERGEQIDEATVGKAFAEDVYDNFAPDPGVKDVLKGINRGANYMHDELTGDKAKQINDNIKLKNQLLSE